MTDKVPGRHWRQDDRFCIDARGLSPPDPMVAVIWHLEQPGQRDPVTVMFDRYPVHLIQELAERGWLWQVEHRDNGDVVLELRKAP